MSQIRMTRVFTASNVSCCLLVLLLTTTCPPALADDVANADGKYPVGDPLYSRPAAATEEMPLTLPDAGKLLPMGDNLPPIRLEASYTQPISLQDALTYTLENNLPIRISRADARSQKWLYMAALGRYLPNITMNYRQELLSGARLIGGVIPITFHTPNVTTEAGFDFTGFKGGLITFSALAQLHSWRAAKATVGATIRDALLAVTRAYYDVMLNQALLQIQVIAVDVSRAQLKLNQQLEAAGTGTRFNVLQSETQLASDEQNLIEQEVTLRQSAIRMAAVLNLNLAVNLLPQVNSVRKVRLIDPKLKIDDLLKVAVTYRPELMRVRNQLIKSRREVQVAAAPLYPDFNFFGKVIGSGATLGKSEVLSTTQTSFDTPQVVSGTLSPVAIAAAPPPGIPIVLPGTPPGTINAAGVVFNPPVLVNRQIRKSYQMGFKVDWNYPSLGVPDLANVQSRRALVRSASFELNRELQDVIHQVRRSYLNSQTAEMQIDVATKAVISSTEQLRLAQVRLANGVGTNLDVIAAQRAYIEALSAKAQAIIEFNRAQAQLLRDIGLISIDTLVSGRLVRG